MASPISNSQWVMRAQRMHDQLNQHNEQAPSSYSSLSSQQTSPQPFNAHAATATLLSSMTQPDIETNTSTIRTVDPRYRTSDGSEFWSGDGSKSGRSRAVSQLYSDIHKSNASANLAPQTSPVSHPQVFP